MPVHHFLEYDRKLDERARALRREMTPQERKLWFLYLKKQPVKIYRQRVIGLFIVDFYCASAHLVIEADGASHYTEQGHAYDDERSDYLESLGLHILRFSNQQIDHDFRAVCETIGAEIEKGRRLKADASTVSP